MLADMAVSAIYEYEPVPEPMTVAGRLWLREWVCGGREGL